MLEPDHVYMRAMLLQCLRTAFRFQQVNLRTPFWENTYNLPGGKLFYTASLWCS